MLRPNDRAWWRERNRSLPAIFDGESVRLLEHPVDRRPYRVLVTFVEPDPDSEIAGAHTDHFMGSFNAWRDDRTADEIIRDLRSARQSRHDPPTL